MILLFGENANKTAHTQHPSKPKTNTIENSGILAMSISDAKMYLSAAEYDTYVSSSPIAIDYAMAMAEHAYNNSDGEGDFISSYSQALAFLSSGGDITSGASFGFGGDSGCSVASCSFSSVG